jgi:hypothetical protein
MQKVYLLRNNQKSGPFTLPELWQQSAQPSDMIWIEGKSTAWTRLYNLELNLPVEEAEEPIVFIDHRKQKNNILGEVLMTIFIVALLGGGLLGGRSLFRSQPTSALPAVTRMSTGDEHTAVNPQPITASSLDTQTIATVTPPPPALPIVRKPPMSKQVQPDITPIDQPLNNDSEKVLVKQQDLPKPPPAHTEEKVKTEITTPAQAAEEKAEPQKKKTLGQALKNLFHKKKKDDRE